MEETIEDLVTLKAKNIIKLLEKVNKLFSDGIAPRDMEKRNEIIDTWEDGKYE